LDGDLVLSKRELPEFLGHGKPSPGTHRDPRVWEHHAELVIVSSIPTRSRSSLERLDADGEPLKLKRIDVHPIP